MTVDGLRCLVTGITGGLGAECGRHFREIGWHVIGTARRAAQEADLSAMDRYICMDGRTEGAIDSLLESVGCGLDLVILAAVTYEAPADNVDYASTLATMFDVNAFFPYMLARSMIERLESDRFTLFIFVNSEAMFNADRLSAPYAASKAALRVLASGLAESCKGKNASVVTLTLGPLADDIKLRQLRAVADKKGLGEAEITRLFLQKSNPNLVIDQLIPLSDCARFMEHIYSLGVNSNGMVCRLDGGAAGSLI